MGSRLPSWSVWLPSLLLRLMLMPSMGPTMETTGETTGITGEATGTTGGTTGTTTTGTTTGTTTSRDRDSTHSPTARDLLMLRLMLMSGTTSTLTPAAPGQTVPTT